MIHMKIKSYQKDMMMFLMEFWVKLEKWMMISLRIEKTI